MHERLFLLRRAVKPPLLRWDNDFFFLSFWALATWEKTVRRSPGAVAAGRGGEVFFLPVLLRRLCSPTCKSLSDAPYVTWSLNSRRELDVKDSAGFLCFFLG